jgi:hypothetical protein
VCTIEEIIALVSKKSGASVDEIKPDSDIFHDIGLVGDDFHELIEEYAKKYSVNMESYLWYFHADEEGRSFGGEFFAPPYRLVKRIPVTPIMLVEFANKGKWDISYPEHTLPKRRNDLLINRIMLYLFIVGVIVYLVYILIA